MPSIGHLLSLSCVSWLACVPHNAAREPFHAEQAVSQKKEEIPKEAIASFLMKRKQLIASFGIASFGIASFGIASFGIASFGIASFGIASFDFGDFGAPRK